MQKPNLEPCKKLDRKQRSLKNYFASIFLFSRCVRDKNAVWQKQRQFLFRTKHSCSTIFIIIASGDHGTLMILAGSA